MQVVQVQLLRDFSPFAVDLSGQMQETCMAPSPTTDDFGCM